MKRLKLPRCPHCGKKLNFADAWLMHTKGEYRCEKCCRDADILYDSVLYFMAFLTALLGLSLYFVQYLLLQGRSWRGVFFVLLPFVIFQIFTPFFMHLKKRTDLFEGENSSPASSARHKASPQNRGRAYPQNRRAQGISPQRQMPPVQNPGGVYPQNRRVQNAPPQNRGGAYPQNQRAQGIPPQRQMPPAQNPGGIYPQNRRVQNAPPQNRGGAYPQNQRAQGIPPQYKAPPQNAGQPALKPRGQKNPLDEFFKN